MTGRRQIVCDAVDATVSGYVSRVLRGGVDIVDVERWSYRVAVNAARRLGAAAARSVGFDDLPRGEPTSAVPLAAAAVDDVARASGDLSARLQGAKKKLTAKQFRVLCHLSRGGMSLHRAAKELAMDRSNLRRMFRRALEAVTAADRGPPPASGG